jgi:hypothetical protein
VPFIVIFLAVSYAEAALWWPATEMALTSTAIETADIRRRVIALPHSGGRTGG